MTARLGANVAVISPHLDDAVLSLGAAIADASADGTDVLVVTVLSGDPEAAGPSTSWDRSAGFRTAAEAAQQRREEDLRACSLIGARAIWLPFAYGENRAGVDERAVSRAVDEAIDNADAVLIPGFPLTNPDHAWLASLLFAHLPPGRRIGLYLEQPYVPWRSRQRPDLPECLVPFVRDRLCWRQVPSSRAARRHKRRACRAYASQLPLLRGRRLSPPLEWRVTFYEARSGGETLAWLDDQ